MGRSEILALAGAVCWAVVDSAGARTQELTAQELTGQELTAQERVPRELPAATAGGASEDQAPAFAQGDDPEVARESAPAARPIVMVGFHTVQGAPRYGVRSTSDSGAATVRFSARRPRAAGFNGAVPDRLPVSGARLTSQYGFRVHPITGRGSSHHGIDLAVSTGTPVIATSDGNVLSAGWAGNYGLLVAIDHGDGMETRYGHLSAISVQPGQRLQKGDVVGRSGSTGRSTGPHVHYEVRVDGLSVDPMPD